MFRTWLKCKLAIIEWPSGDCWNGILIYSVGHWKYEFKYAVLIIPEHSPYGPSPLGRPSPETRAFLSPPTLLEGPLRLSPLLPGGGGRGILFNIFITLDFFLTLYFHLIFKMISKMILWKIQAFLALIGGCFCLKKELYDIHFEYIFLLETLL